MYSKPPVVLSRSSGLAQRVAASSRSSTKSSSAPVSPHASSLPADACINHFLYIFGNIMSIHGRPRKPLATLAKRHFASSAAGGSVTLDPHITTLGELLGVKEINNKHTKNTSTRTEGTVGGAAASQSGKEERYQHKSKYREAFKALENIYTKLKILPKRHQLLAIFEAAASAADVPFIQSLLQVMTSQFRIKVDHQLLGLYMKALFQFGDSAAAMAVLDEMRRAEDRNMRPTAQTYSIVLSSIKESGLSLQDIQAWLRLDDALGKDPSSWEALIEHRAKEEDCDRGFELLQFALRHGIPIHASTYMCLIQRFSADQRYDEAENVIALMLQNGTKLTRTSCAVLADYYFKKGDQDKGREWLEMLNEKCSTAATAPNPASISTVINTIVKYGTKADLERFWLQSKRLSTTWSIAGFTAIVYAFYKFKDRQTAADIVLQVIDLASANKIEIDKKFCSLILTCVVEPSLAVAVSRVKSRLTESKTDESLASFAKSDVEFQAYVSKMHPQSRRWLVLDEAESRRILSNVDVQKFASWFQLAYRTYIRSR
eukprot:TRINITY_DN15611_c0_g1_i1.p1 TRINITY_DN15611_c0_g1~~TRINITY_DN15611_c0_g1_i1.p1  ORF type:complete len:545 (+),score=94.13 TRINITY_DN15611_c0_g1_i1:115-1749(+)